MNKLYVVARDGSGDFTTIQEAIDAVPEGFRSPTILLLRADAYHERVIVNKDNLRIIGEDRDRTVITYSACAKDLDENGQEKGTFLSYTMLVTGRNVEVENLTIRNDAGDGRQVGQAVAVYAAGDRGVWRNCRMIAHQDTLFCGPTMPLVQQDALPHVIPEGVPAVNEPLFVNGRQYFEDCFIQGDVDFIFGSYRCWFERCTLFMNERGGWYTAANTPKSSPHGFVFHRCRLTGACAEGAAYLGRPWRAWARTVFLGCEMDERVHPQGFADWDGGRPVTDLYGEHGTTGARADQSTRHPKQKRLTDAEAALLTMDEVISGYDQWHPDRRVPTWFLCGDESLRGSAAQLSCRDTFVQDCTADGCSPRAFADQQLKLMELCLRPGDRLVIGFAAHGADDAACLDMLVEAAHRHQAEPLILNAQK